MSEFGASIGDVRPTIRAPRGVRVEVVEPLPSKHVVVMRYAQVLMVAALVGIVGLCFLFTGLHGLRNLHQVVIGVVLLGAACLVTKIGFALIALDIRSRIRTY